jgi:adenosylcobinamide kinase/adenosylcobinamide-phosphate guanylyltransferase
MRVFISGGCKNGKSHIAQQIAKAQQNTNALYYIATMKPVDQEDDERIERHIQEREGWGFTTIEQYTDIEEIAGKCDGNGSFMLDSMTALLANEMFLPDRSINREAGAKIISGLSQALIGIGNIVIISDHIYSDASRFDLFTELYREALASIDRTVAELCDIVLEVAYTNIVVHKGKEMYDALHDAIEIIH